MSTLQKPRLTPTEYLRRERQSDVKHQYFDGEVFAMAGASRAHNRLTANIGALLNQQFRGRPCEEFISDLRVKIEASGLYTYPDVVALCQPPRFEDDQLDTLINPEVIFEVLSESTETYDRGRKFAQYRMLPSLAEYILVAQDRVSVEHFKRQENGSWLLRPLSESTDVLIIGTVDCQLSLADIYAKVDLSSSAAGSLFPC